MKIRQPQMLDPRSSQLGSTTDHQEKTHSNDHVPRRTPTWDRRHRLHWHRRHLQLVLEVSVSHGDSAISHPRDQDYLSLKGGMLQRVGAAAAKAYMVANLRKWEREEKQWNERHLAMTKKRSWTPTYVKHSTDRVHFPDSAEKRPSRLHTQLMSFNWVKWQVIYNQTLTNSHLPHNRGHGFRKIIPCRGVPT